MRLSRLSPATALFLVGFIGLCLAWAAVMTATSQPWLGMRLSAGSGSRGLAIVRIDPDGPAAGPRGDRLAAIDGWPVAAGDILDEPDQLPSYAKIAVFLERQSELHRMLSKPSVRVTVADASGEQRTSTVVPRRRPLAALSAEFWVQVAVGLGGFLIGAWVWTLRPRDVGAILFGLSGLGLLISTFCAAIYSTRELALDGTLFRLLSGANHAGATLFGYVMICLFLTYPRRLIAPWLTVAVAPLPAAWLVADLLRLAPSPFWGAVFPLLLEFVAIACAVGLQWRATRSDPVGRAALRWLGLSVVICAGAAVATFILPSHFGGELVPQSYAFIFFFLIYAAMAVGLRRSRIFQLDEWAFRVAFYSVAALMLLVVDGLLILLLNTGAAVTLGASLLAVAFVYLPTRDWLWRRFVVRRRMDDDELFGDVVDTALAANPAERIERWRALLVRLFDPLQIEQSPHPRDDVEILEDGLAMALPATSASPALILRGPWAGRGLFGVSHLRLARKANDMITRTETRRDDYERGAAEERQRIAQDLHDDVGSLLLSGLHKPQLDDTRQVIRDAMFDVRMLASELSSQRRVVGDLLADLRHETLDRLESAGVALSWPMNTEGATVLLDAAAYRATRSSVRELVSNVIRHSGATRVEVKVIQTPVTLSIEIADNGRGVLGPRRPGALGLDGVARRMQAVGGTVDLPQQARGLTAVVTLPLPAMAAQA